MIVLGLTGSIGMGKSTTTGLFRAEGVPVHDADAAVHALYEAGGLATGPVLDAFPEARRADGGVDRAALGAAVVGKPEALARLEAIVHPLVAADRGAFLARAQQAGAAVAVLDVPLLFESGADRAVDAVVVVSAPAQVQRERVLARPGMTPQTLDAILARQIPDAEKRARAAYVIDTGRGIDAARDQVRGLLRAIAAQGPPARQG